AGPWSAPRLLLPGRGLIDPCPLWDEDGRAYLVHGWARSRARVKNRLSLLEVTPDLSAALSPSQVIIDRDDLPRLHTPDGPAPGPGCSGSRGPRPSARAAGSGSTRPRARWPPAPRRCSVPGTCTGRTRNGSRPSRPPPPPTVRTRAPRSTMCTADGGPCPSRT